MSDAARLCFVVESGTDVRLVEGLAARFHLTVLARRIRGGVEVSHPTTAPHTQIIGPASRASFAAFAFRHVFGARPAYDIVVVQGYALAAAAVNLACRLRRRRAQMLVCSPTERYYACRRLWPGPGMPFRWWEYAAVRALARVNACLGTGYIVLSRHLEQVVRSHGARCPVAVVPVYGVDLACFHPAREAKAEVRQRLGLPEEGVLVLFNSRMAPEKDAETFLEAVRALVSEGHDIRVLHRSGGYRPFATRAAASGLADRVVATDAVHPHRELPRDYQAAGLFVQASREEGLGFAPLEALACGVPVVAARVGGLRETIRDNDTGWTYPAGDAGALARAMAAALAAPEEAARRVAAGRAMVERDFERERSFDRFADVLQGSAGTP